MVTVDRRTFLGASAGVAAALSSGAATRAAASPARAANAPRTPDPDAPLHQMRGVWIASVANTDWPSSPDLSPAQQQAELISLYDIAIGAGLTTVVLQVRPTADAFWPSPYEPWSVWLTGTQGKDPGYDPLGFAVREAHRRNLGVHAWFNPYRISISDDLSALVPSHPARRHPHWVAAYGGQLYYNPGIPAVRRFVQRAIMDAVEHYDIDAVHFDDYFYPYPVAGEQFPDDAAFARYGRGWDDRGDWRRDNTNQLITELGAKIHAAKPHVQFGVSPFGVWRNKSTDPRGSATMAGAQCYDDLYADVRRWTRRQWIDYVAPQIYWAQGFELADYDVLVPWWAGQIRESGSRTRLYIGQATYKVGDSTQSPAWDHTPAELSNHLRLNQRYPQVAGDIFYNATAVAADLLGATSLVAQRHYQHPALTPTMPWLDATAPGAVGWLRARRGPSHTVRLRWAASPAARMYAVYRFPGHVHPRTAELIDATNLLATVPGTVDGDPTSTVRWTDTGAYAGGPSTYAVAVVDELGNSSQLRSEQV